MPKLGGSAFQDKKVLLRSLGTLTLLQRQHQSQVVRAATVLLTEIRETLNQPGSGRVYPSRTGSGLHQASKPGEPPAPDTFELRKSGRIEHHGVFPRTFARVVVGGPRAPYAPPLEFGSRDRKLLPRPFMAPSLKRATPKMRRIMLFNVRISELGIG